MKCLVPVQTNLQINLIISNSQYVNRLSKVNYSILYSSFLLWCLGLSFIYIIIYEYFSSYKGIFGQRFTGHQPFH